MPRGRGARRAAARRRARSASSVSSSASDSQRRDRVDAARREEDELRAVAPRQLEAVVGADEVRSARRSRGRRRARPAPRARPSTRRSRRTAPTASEVGELPHVAVDELDARPPAAAARFSSEPRRRRLSRATSSQSGCRSARRIPTLAPTNPAPPVTSTLIVADQGARATELRAALPQVARALVASWQAYAASVPPTHRHRLSAGIVFRISALIASELPTGNPMTTPLLSFR